MVSLKRIAAALSGLGALAISVHAAVMLVGFCAGDTACTASVYFGVPQTTNFPNVGASIAMPASTPSMIDDSSFGLKDVHAIIQVVGVYALLIGVTLLLLLEVKELKFLQNAAKKKRRA